MSKATTGPLTAACPGQSFLIHTVLNSHKDRKCIRSLAVCNDDQAFEASEMTTISVAAVTRKDRLTLVFAL